MDEQTSATDRRPFAEGLATTALFLNLIAVVASAMCLAGFALAESTLAITAGVMALLTFSTSMFCFAMDSTLQERRDAVGAKSVALSPET